MNKSAHPLVSVLIPCYNAGRWIGENMESVLAQTWPNMEIIVVNDGSTDDSRSVLERLWIQGGRVKLINPTERWNGCAQKPLSVKESSGEYIQYLDADDLFASARSSLQMSAIGRANPRLHSHCKMDTFSCGAGEAEFVSPDETWQDLKPVEWLVRTGRMAVA